jgi:polysaccharide export outer membrane protein
MAPNFFNRASLAQLNKPTLYAALLLLCFILFVGCSARPSLSTGEEVTIESQTFSFSAPDFEHLAQYKLVPGDVLDVLFQIQTWLPEVVYYISLGDTVSVKFPHLPELNETQKVLPDGTVSLPYIGVVNVFNKTSAEVATELSQKYSTILVETELYVTVPEYLSQIRELKHDLHTSTRGLSRLVTIRPDGYVTFPMIGDVFVSAKTLPEVKNILNSHYKEVSTSLHADLFLERHSGSKVYVMGEVEKPGAYTITKPISIIQAIALAEGNNKDAMLDQVHVIRRQGKKMIATRVNVANGLNFTDDGSLFYLLPDDIVYIPATRISDAAHIAKQVGDVLFFRGWSLGFSWQLHSANNETTTLVPEP